MAREVTIRNGKFIKTPLNIADIISKDNYGYGSLDEYYRMEWNKLTEDALLILDNDSIGRGVRIIGLGNRKKMQLALSLPATETDVKMFYRLVARIAHLWKADYVFVDSEKVGVEEMDACIHRDMDISIGLLRDAGSIFKSEYVDFPCATLPVSFTVRQLYEFASDMKGFEAVLHEKQSIGAFFSVPLLHEADGVQLALYTIFDDGHIVLPDVPLKTFRRGEELVRVSSFVVCADLFPYERVSKMPFADFLESVPAVKKSRFDCRHTLIGPLSVEELRAIFTSGE